MRDDLGRVAVTYLSSYQTHKVTATRPCASPSRALSRGNRYAVILRCVAELWRAKCPNSIEHLTELYGRNSQHLHAPVTALVRAIFAIMTPWH